jgi:sulfate permease, SulP family
MRSMNNDIDSRDKLDFKSEFTPKLFLCLRNYSLKIFYNDLLAGVTVGIVALPLAMALAIASGVRPEQGLYTAIIAGFFISLFGGSRIQIGGPTAAFIVIVYGIVERHGYNGLVLTTILAGVILLILGFGRFGTLIKFIPYPVTTGFTSGIAVVIFSGQIKDFLGLPIATLPADFISKWQSYYANYNAINLYALGIGIVSLLIMLILRKVAPRIPGAIVVVILGSLLVGFFNIPVETIGSRFGDIPSSLPKPQLPSFDFPMFQDVIPEAITVALLAGIESLLTCVIADGLSGDRHKSNVELVAQGTANIFSALFCGIPATGAIARTATNFRSGAQTPIAGIVHAITIMMVMLLFAQYAKLIPLATLAAILILVAWSISEIDHFRYILRAPRGDVACLLSAFFLTVFVDITRAVEVGVVLAALSFMSKMSEQQAIVSHSEMSNNNENVSFIKQRKLPSGVEVFEMNGPLFFGVVDYVKNVLNVIKTPPKYFIIGMKRVPVIDASGMHALREFSLKCKRQKTQLMLADVQPRVYETFQKFNFLEEIGADNITDSIEQAVVKAGSF